MGDLGPSYELFRWLGIRVGSVWDFVNGGGLLGVMLDVVGKLSEVVRVK